MKLRDLVFRLSAHWEIFALSEWDRNTGKEISWGTWHTIGQLEDYIAGEDWEVGWYDVVNVRPMSGGHGLHIIVARA